MPTLGLKHPPDDIAWEIPVPAQYLTVALLVILVAIRALFARWRTLRRPDPGLQTLDAKRGPGQFSLASASEKDRQKFEADFGPGPGRQGPPTYWARGFVPLRVVSSQLGPAGTLPTMDDTKGELGEDHYPWSALAASRGVSTSSPKAPHDPSDTGRIPFTVTERTRRSRSPRTSSRASSGTRHSGSSDGIAGQAPRDKGKGSMTGGSSHADGSSQAMGLDGDAGAQTGSSQSHTGPFQGFPGTDFRIPRHFTRPPPPPPLTPPTLSGAFFPFEDRRPSYATSIPPALDTSFIHQPNPEYGDSTSTDVLSSSPQSATPFPRRRSYTRSVPIGIPVPTTTASASSSNETMTSGSTTNSFSPSSYPPTSPLLPPPPPGQYELPPSAPPEYEFVGGPGGPGIFLSQQEIDLQGEIISVVDDAGHGWKRHTRVYGGGTCLACVAATQRDDAQGGFYGDKVPLEDRR